MLRTLLLGAIGAAIVFGALSAQVTPAPPVAINQSITAIAGPGDVASMGELHWIGGSFSEDVVILLRDVTLLGIGVLVIGMGAVCVNARRALGGKAFAPQGEHAPV